MAYNVPKSLKVLQVASVDALVNAATTIATTDASGRFIPICMNAQATSIVNYAGFPSISIGTNAPDYDNILQSTPLSVMDTTNQTLNTYISNVIASVPPSTAIKVNVQSTATADAYVLKVSILGWYN